MVYIGILDDGSVYGVRLTEYQKDHVLLDVQDTFQRFDPPVDETMYLVRFVPVLDPQDAQNGVVSIPDRLRCGVFPSSPKVLCFDCKLLAP